LTTAGSDMRGLLQGDRAGWQRRYTQLVLGLDLVGLALVTLVTAMIRFGEEGPLGLPHEFLAGALTLIWLVGLATARCYDTRFMLSEASELLRVVKASLQVFAVVALLNFLTKAHVSRAYVLITYPLGAAALVLSRLVAHRALRNARAHGRAQNRVLVVGDVRGLHLLADAFSAMARQGYRVVGACIPDGSTEPFDVDTLRSVPVTNSLSDIADAVRACQADTVAVCAGPAISDVRVRQLCYDLEGLGVDTLLAPSLTEVAGPRISVRPVAGLPLLHLDEPELDGVHKVVKGVFDRVCAAFGLLLLAPVLFALWASIRMTSKGGVIFKQARVGRDGELFQVWKFRSMYPDAEGRLADLQQFNEHEGPLFKMKNDPRITPIGRLLRKYSLDELPQLVNVLKGDMSLVGPRPPLPAEVAKYDGHAHRRLLVKPGITGLWQVSGRADLNWEQAVRLDLAYVDGWSLGFDLAILARTAMAVVRSSGAY
jgi:exopolysaccharide biosynthesis polyprenyl glycosylphosphotransferase